MKLISIYAFIFMLGIAFAQGVFYFPVMSETMASHFGFEGEANGWMSKTGFVFIEIVIILIVCLSFIAMPILFEKFGIKKSLNLPNKDYWTAPERIDSVYKYFRNSFAWFGVITMILLVGTFQLVFEANLLPEPILNMRIFLIIFVSYLSFVTIGTILFIRKFTSMAKTN